MKPFLLGLLVVSTPALANPVTCSQGELSRTIEVVYSDPGQPVPCEVIYDKSAEGSIESLWRAGTESGYCELKAESLKQKLEGLGWSCGATEGQSASSASSDAST